MKSVCLSAPMMKLAMRQSVGKIMDTDLCCVLAPYYRCESCGAVQCSPCAQGRGSSFDKSHPRSFDQSFKCNKTGMKVVIPWVNPDV